MNHSDFEKVFETQVQQCRDTLVRKGAEYSPLDRFSNFKIAASFQGVTPKQALGGMLAKHIVSVYDLVREPGLVSLDMWEEKLGDALNYLFLLKGLVMEERWDLPVETVFYIHDQKGNAVYMSGLNDNVEH